MSALFIKKIQINWDRVNQESYLHGIQSISGLDEIQFNKPVTFFVGENGSGKSTLLEGIAVAAGFNPEGGSKNYRFSTYDSHSELFDALTLVRNTKEKWGYYLRAESFYNVATMENEYSKQIGGIPQHYHEKSHGESFLKLILGNMNEAGLYILDEPEAALSPQRQLSLLSIMHESVKNGSQFIVASHSPILLGYPDGDILCFDGPLHSVEYEETESYKITKMFVNNKEQILKNLFDEE